MDDYGNDTGAQWRAIDDLKKQCSHNAQEIALVRADMERHQKQGDRLIEMVAALTGKIDAMTVEFAEARGGLKIGRLIAQTIAGAVVMCAAVLTYFKGG